MSNLKIPEIDHVFPCIKHTYFYIHIYTPFRLFDKMLIFFDEIPV